MPVDFQDFSSDNEELAVLVSDNRIAEISETDDDELKAILKQLEGKIDLDLTGFTAIPWMICWIAYPDQGRREHRRATSTDVLFKNQT